MNWGFNRKGFFRNEIARFSCEECELTIIKVSWTGVHTTCPKCNNKAYLVPRPDSTIRRKKK